MNTKNKKTKFYTALAKAPQLLKEYINQYTQGQVDFPDELVEAFTQAQGDVTKIEQMCNNIKKSKEGAQIMKVAEQVYNAAQQEIDSEIESTGMFKDGGKVDYLRKLSKGSGVPENPYVFQSDTTKVSPTKTIISQRFTPGTKGKDGKVSYGDWGEDSFRVITQTPQGQSIKYFGAPGWGDNDYMEYGSGEHFGYMPVSGEEMEYMHQRMAEVLDYAISRIKMRKIKYYKRL